MTWQPIDTAPQDGTWVLAAIAGEAVYFVSWSAEYSGWFDEYGIREDPWDGNKIHPTHWQPLPAPPPPEEPKP
jgi:hypothetical protein